MCQMRMAHGIYLDFLRFFLVAFFGPWFKTRLSRCIPVMAVWRCAGLLSPQPVSGTLALSGLLPRLVGVTCARCWLLGAKTLGSG